MNSIYLDDRWIKLQEQKENGKGIEYVWNSDEYKVVYPFIKRVAGKINNIVYYDLVTPRGQGGPRLECDIKDKEEIIKKFNEEFQNYCIKENIIAEYIRFDPWIKNYEDFSEIYNCFSKGNIYCNNLNVDFFTSEYSSKVRNYIRKAEKNNIIVEFDFEGKTIDDFLEIYNYTSDKYNISDYYTLDRNFLKNYYELFNGQVCIANAIYDNKIISSAIILFGEDIVHYHFSSTNPNYRSLQPNTYIIYETELLAKEKGKKLFDFGRAGEGSNLEKFKLEFINNKRDKVYEYKVGTKIRNSEIYNELVNKRGGKHEGYFPEYR